MANKKNKKNNDTTSYLLRDLTNELYSKLKIKAIKANQSLKVYLIDLIRKDVK